MGIQGHVFAHATVFHDQFDAFIIHDFCWNPIHRTGAHQVFPLRFEPFFFVPIFHGKVLLERKAVAGEIHVAAVASFAVHIDHTQHIDKRFG